MKTAIDLSIDKIKGLQSNIEIGDFTKRAYAICMYVLEDFKKIEKQQIIDAYAQGFIESERMDKGAEQYYNETFKTINNG
jgi:hypothetical protein